MRAVRVTRLGNEALTHPYLVRVVDCDGQGRDNQRLESARTMRLVPFANLTIRGTSLILGDLFDGGLRPWHDGPEVASADEVA